MIGQGVAAFPRAAVIWFISLYQAWSATRLPSCRFDPSCSQYALEAVRHYGFMRGVGLTVVRLLKCGPWHRGGWDPIPDRCLGLAAEDLSHHQIRSA